MTLILGIEDAANGRAVLAADSGVWQGNTVQRLAMPKLVRQGDWIVGGAGWWCFVKQGLTTPIPPSADDEAALQEWAMLVLEKQASMGDTIRRGDTEAKPQTPTFVAAKDSRCWSVNDGAVTRSEGGVEAAGADEMAYAAEMATRIGMVTEPAFVRLATTVRAVGAVTTCVRAPWMWMATDGTEGTWE